jgi:putative phosphoesterase
MPKSVTVAIVSDTHGYLDARIERLIHECDYAVHAGDILGAQVLRAMRPRREKVYVVAGNNDAADKWNEADRDVVRDLPRVVEIELPAGRVVVEHGDRHGHHAPRHDLLRRAHPNARAIVYGHSHKMVCDCDEDPWVLNPGAAGRVRTHGGPSCLVLSASTREWTVAKFRFSNE